MKITLYDSAIHDKSEILRVVNTAYKGLYYLQDAVDRITLNELEDVLTFESHKIIVCAQKKMICGVIFLDLDNMMVSTLAVDPAHRGKNIGEKLLNYATQEALLQHSSKLSLTVIPYMQEGLVRFYQKNGFAFVNKQEPFSSDELKRYIKPEYYRLAVPVRMEKILT